MFVFVWLASAGVIIGGWDPKDGGQVYTVTLGGTLHRQGFSIGGAGTRRGLASPPPS
jgi:20S proteasome subunit beta 1